MVGALPATQQMRMTMVLQLRNQDQLKALLSDLYNPASPNYRHFLSVDQFAAQFGPTPEDYQAVVQYARSNGFQVTDTPANRLVVPIVGTVAQVEAAFHVTMNQYKHPTENRNFYSPDREPTLAVSVPVAHIAGLNNYSLPRPLAERGTPANGVAPATGSGPGYTYLGSDMRAAYYGGTALTGFGQTVGVVEFDGYDLSDVNLTFSNSGQTYTVPINNVLVDGATGQPVTGDDAEQVLDIVQAIGMAPGLDQVRVYIENAYVSNDATVLNAIAAENIAQEVSISWLWEPDDPQTDDVFFEEMAAQGQSVFVASGDNGAYDENVSPFFYPAEDIYVTAVGGTHLNTNGAGGPWVSETGWYFSGGGISPDQIPLPSWQSIVSSGINATFRMVPDVAMEADFDNYTCDMGLCMGDWGGTSFATPRWAAYIALANEQAAEAGEKAFGFLDPLIYSLAESTSYTDNFHDIVLGDDDCCGSAHYFNAYTGYDLVTGWGSPNGPNLINTLAPVTASGFILAVVPDSPLINPGTSELATVSIYGVGGFSGSVNLSISGLPSGVTATWSANPASSTSTLTLSASSAVALGSYLLTVTGTSGTITRSAKIALTVANPSFTLSQCALYTRCYSTNEYWTTPGASAGGLIYLSGSNGFSGAVALSVTGLPPGVTVSFGSNPMSSSSTYQLCSSCTFIEFEASFSATPVISTVTITGTSGSLVFSTTATVAVLPAVVPTPSLFSPPNANLGSVAVGSLSPVQTLSYTFASAATLGSIAVLTQGAKGLDFTDAGTGTCAANASYAAGQSCTVNVLFKPRFAGTRYGAVVLYGTDGIAIAIDYLQGTGLGLQLTYQPGTQNTIATFTPVTSWPSAIAVDASGNVYVTTQNTGQLYKETLSGVNYIQSIVPTSDLEDPEGVAVDGAGNIYVVDEHRVLKETPFAGSYLESVIASVPGFFGTGVAVDGSGNVYFCGGSTGQYTPAVAAYKETLTASGYVQSTVVSGLPGVFGIAVDGSGNVYIADWVDGWIVKATPAAGGYTQSTIPVSGPGGGLYGVAVDGIGDVYVTHDYGFMIDGTHYDLGQIYKEAVTADGYSQSTISSLALNQPWGVAVDGAGNVYIADSYNAQAVKEDLRTPPSLSFATTPFGSTSSDSPETVALANIGNANVDVSALSYPPDFPEAPGITGDCTSRTSLTAGESCTLSIDFTPLLPLNGAASAVLNESVKFTTNANPQAQSVPLTGTGTPALTAMSVGNATAAYSGSAQNVTLTAAVTSVAGTVNAGTVTFTVSNGKTAVGTPTTSGTVANGAGGVSFALPAGTAPGSYTIQAAYSDAGGSFSGSTGSGSLTVSQATPGITLTSSSNPQFLSDSVTFTATLNGGTGVPTGTVTFYDGTTQLKSAPLSGATSTLTTSSLTTGTHSITAVYSGDSNYLTVTSTAVSELVETLTLTTSSGIATINGSPGGQATYSMTLTPPAGTTFPEPITFSVSGLPDGATATFSPNPIPAGSGTTNVTMTIDVPSTASMRPLASPFGRGALPVALGLFLLPFASRLRKAGRKLRHAMVIVVAGVALMAGLTVELPGCGGGTPRPPRSYALSLTATSGSYSASTPLTLTVQ